MRYAIVTNDLQDSVAAYLPNNYSCVQVNEDVLIFGNDEAGWTLDDYVIPRLASGLHWAREYVLNEVGGSLPGDPDALRRRPYLDRQRHGQSA